MPSDERLILAYTRAPNNTVAYAGTIFRSPLDKEHPDYRAFTMRSCRAHGTTALRRLRFAPRILKDTLSTVDEEKMAVVRKGGYSDWPSQLGDNTDAYSNNVDAREALEAHMVDTVFIRNRRSDPTDADDYATVCVKSTRPFSPDAANAFWCDDTFPALSGETNKEKRHSAPRHGVLPEKKTK